MMPDREETMGDYARGDYSDIYERLDHSLKKMERVSNVNLILTSCNKFVMLSIWVMLASLVLRVILHFWGVYP